MNILSCLVNQSQWQCFYEYKVGQNHLSRQDFAALADFISGEKYLPYANKIEKGEPFAPPRRAVISKLNSEKKRIVYIYSQEENFVLKFLTFLLQRKYDGLFLPQLYSFRPGIGVRNAIMDLTRQPGLSGMWCYKADIRNYFNSIPIDRLLPVLEKALSDEPVLFRFLSNLLTDPMVNERGRLTVEEKGIMAGTPVSTFLANLYLSHLDRAFSGRIYARYSDDIILFSPTREQLEHDISRIHTILADAGLSINSAKEQRFSPEQAWVFLGFSYHNGTIDVAPVSVEKLKGKMRRKTRALARWASRKNVPGTGAAKAFIRVFNRKLFENPIDHELTWARWYFPLISTTESLQAIDHYAQSCIRYLATGRHTKAAHNFRYEEMKQLGYVSLVNRYYSHRRSRDGSE